MDYKKKYIKYKNKYLKLKGGTISNICKSIKNINPNQYNYYYEGTTKSDKLDIINKNKINDKTYFEKNFKIFKCNYNDIIDEYKKNLIWGFGIEQELPILFNIPEELNTNIYLNPYKIILPNNNNYLSVSDFLVNTYNFIFPWHDSLTDLISLEEYTSLKDIIEQINDENFIYNNLNNLLQDFFFLSKFKSLLFKNKYITYFNSLLINKKEVKLIINDLEQSKLKYMQNNILIYFGNFGIDYIQNNIIEILIQKTITINKYFKVTIFKFTIKFKDEQEQVSNYYKISSYTEFTKILEKDSGGYELRTDNYSNTTIKNAVSELNNKRRFLIEQFQNIYSTTLFFPDDYLFYKKNGKYQYTGELELNITLPYNKSLEIEKNTNRDNEINNFKTRHMNLMKILQYLSPLFLGCFTSTFPESFNDNNINPETSFRFYIGLQSIRILVTDVNNIYNLLNDSNTQQHYDYIHPIIYKIFSEFINITIPNNYTLSTNHHEKKVRGHIEFSVNRNSNKFDPSANKFFGFEWKVLDQYNYEDANKITLFVLMLAQHIENNDIEFKDEDPREYFKVENEEYDGDWRYEFLKEIIKEGWHVKVNEEYIKNIIIDKLKFKEDDLTLIDGKYTGNIYDFLLTIHRYLFDEFKKKYTDCYILECFYPDFKNPEKYNDLYTLPNINQNSYIQMYNMLDEEKKIQLNEDNEDFIEKQILNLSH